MPISNIDSVLAVNDALRFAQTSDNTAELTFNIDASVECWSLHLALTEAQYQNFRAGDRLFLKAFRTDNPAENATAAGELYVGNLYITLEPLSQGYVGCRFPNRAREKGQVAGNWTARITLSHFGAASPFTTISLVPAEIAVWLSTRSLTLDGAPPDDARDEFTLPVQFILVSPRDKLSANRAILSDAINQLRTNILGPVFNEVRLFKPEGGPFSIKTTTDEYDTNIRAGITRDLIQEFALPSWINVFVIQNLKTPVPGAVGFAVIPGPQGFKSNQSAIMIIYIGHATTLARRMAHEISHYLGLIHKSACLDNSITYDSALCEAALDLTKPSDPNRALVKGNLMFVSNPGDRLNTPQRYMLRSAPRVNHRLIVPLPTPVTKLRVKVHTGSGSYSWSDVFRGDFAGTDDKVFFQIRCRPGAQGVYGELGSTFTNDFEDDQDKWYQIDSGDSLFAEDIIGFTIWKSYDKSMHLDVFGDDHWLLKGLVVEINDREWYSDDNIKVWLGNDGTLPKSFAADLTPPRALRPMDVPPPHDGQTPSYVTPPFIDYPVALEFDAERQSKVVVPNVSSLSIAGPAMAAQAWIRPTTVAGEQLILSAGDGQNGFFLRIKDGHYEVGAMVQGQENKASGAVPVGDLQHWIHLCGTYDAGVWHIHRNGDHLAQSPPVPGFPSSLPGDLVIGARADGAGGYFNGQMRNVCLWKAPRTAAQELRDLFRIDAHDANVALYLPMSEGDDAICYDQSTNEHDAAISNAVWFTPVSIVPSAMFLRPVKDGVAGYVTIPNTALLNEALAGGVMTVSAWIKSGRGDSASAGERIIFGNDTFALRIKDGRYECGMINSANNLVSVPIPAGDAGSWVHLCGHYDKDAQKWRLLRNGFVVGEQAAPPEGFVPPAANGNWYLGGSPAAHAPPRPLEVRTVWLHAGVVRTKFIRGVYMPWWGEDDLPDHPSLRRDAVIACWPLNEGIGNEIFDYRWEEGKAADGSFISGQVGWSAPSRLPKMKFVDGGTIRSIVLGIGNSSATNPYLVFIGPGTFNEKISLPPYVSLAGAGEQLTTITAIARVNSPYGTLVLADGCFVRQLTVRSLGNTFGAQVVPIEINGVVRVTLDRLTLQTQSENDDVNLRGVCVNAFVTPKYDPAATQVLMSNCTSTVGHASISGSAVSAFSSTLTLINCTSTGLACCGLQAVNGAIATLMGCTIDAGGPFIALAASPPAYIIAQHCQITGLTDGAVTITP